jgi:hypothetical protein
VFGWLVPRDHTAGGTGELANGVPNSGYDVVFTTEIGFLRRLATSACTWIIPSLRTLTSGEEAVSWYRGEFAYGTIPAEQAESSKEGELRLLLTVVYSCPRVTNQ